MSNYHHSTYKYDSVLIELYRKPDGKGDVEFQFKVGKSVFHLVPSNEQLLKIKKFLNEIDLK